MDCIFCRIISGEIPARVICETADSVSMLDAFPLARGHVLVMPKAHSQRIQDMGIKETTDLFLLVRKMASRVDSISGSTLVAIHNGPDAGQEVPHVHVHLVPRSADDSAGAIHRMFGPPLNLSDEESDGICSMLKRDGSQ